MSIPNSSIQPRSEPTPGSFAARGVCQLSGCCTCIESQIPAAFSTQACSHLQSCDLPSAISFVAVACCCLRFLTVIVNYCTSGRLTNIPIRAATAVMRCLQAWSRHSSSLFTKPLPRPPSLPKHPVESKKFGYLTTIFGVAPREYHVPISRHTRSVK